MTIPSSAQSIPLRASGPGKPGLRPAGAQPAPARSNQNAFARALAQAQATRGLTITPGAATSAGASAPFGQQAGLLPDLQMTAQRPASTAAPAPAGLELPGGFGPIVAQAARKYGVDPALIAAVAETESKFNPDAVSKAGAQGLMQLMPGTARGLGVTDASDPLQNVLGGAKLLGQMVEKYGGNLELALAAYNAGSGAVDKYGGIPPYSETRRYVPLVLGAYERFRQQAGAPVTATPATSRATPATAR